jgi:molecular chaperone HscA
MGKIGINIATGSLQQSDMIVGIDLGTTNSLIAVIHPESGKPTVLKEHDGHALVPSVLYFDHHGQVMVGDAAKAHLETEPERTIFSAKRLMGKSYNDLRAHTGYFAYQILDDETDSLVKVRMGDRFYSPIELSSFILKELKQRAEHILKTPVQKVVITVPAYFNDAQRQATRDAGKLAGLDVLRIINEPTAASLAYGYGNTKTASEQLIAVYDLGGGTFDVSVLRVKDGVFEVLSTNGDTFLGGDDFDRAIMDYWLQERHCAPDYLQSNPVAAQALRLKAEAAKKILSSADHYETQWEGTALRIDRASFEHCIQPLVDRTLICCKQALQDAGLSVSELHHVVMVGGSTRVPYVKAAVAAFFGKPVDDSVNPDEVVALGAAIQADILAGNNKELLLLDITPLSMGIETAGGLMDVLIPRNAKIPSRASRQYTTQVDGQSSMRISVFQGERDLVIHNRKLAEFSLSGIPAMPAGMAKVDIAFLINADGILTVRAKELRSGIEQQIEVKPQFGLTDAEVERMLLDSIHHAQDDIRIRALTEARTEAEQLLKTTETFLHRNASFIQQQELLDTAAAMQALQLAITREDKDLIQQKTEALNAVTKPYAERIMDEAIASAIKGRAV